MTFSFVFLPCTRILDTSLPPDSSHPINRPARYVSWYDMYDLITPDICIVSWHAFCAVNWAAICASCHAMCYLITPVMCYMLRSWTCYVFVLSWPAMFVMASYLHHSLLRRVLYLIFVRRRWWEKLKQTNIERDIELMPCFFYFTIFKAIWCCVGSAPLRKFRFIQFFRLLRQRIFL